MTHPLQYLFDKLPHAPVARSDVQHGPMVLFRDVDPREAMRAAGLGTLGESVSAASASLEACFHEFLNMERLDLALQCFAFSIRRRTGAWWAFNCVWDVAIDSERFHNERDQPAATPAKAPAPEPAPVGVTPPSQEDIAQKLQAMADMMPANLSELLGPKPEIPDDPRSPLAQLKARFDAVRARVDAKPMKRVSVRPITPEAAVARPTRKSKPDVPEAMKVHARNASMVQQDSEFRALAASLQWVLEPTQAHAIECRNSAQAISGDSPAKHLAKTAFWCGESLNTKSTPKVPPPPDLARKGLFVSANKALARKDTTWSRTDRLHHFVNLALAVGAGRNAWSEEILADFESTRQALCLRHQHPE